jgi:DNA-directed RNA polymerase subunit F
MFKNYIKSILGGNAFTTYYEADNGSNGGDGSAAGAGDDSNTNTGDDNKGGDNGAGDGSDDTKSKGKTFTQDDVNAIAAKEAKKAMEKVLKQLGVTDMKSAKDGLDQFKKIQDDQKTDAQKATEAAKVLEKTNSELSGQVNTLNAQLAALKADVSPDSLADVIVLANNLVNDDTDIDAAIQQVLKKYPNFKRAAANTTNTDETGKNKKPKFTTGDHNTDKGKPTEQDQWANAFKFFG